MRRASLACALLLPIGAQAGGLMIADDARVATPQSCQAEVWMRRVHDAVEAWALPACNFTGNVEIGFGGARTFAHGESRFTDQLVQAKTLVKPLADDGWGVAFTVGAIRQPGREGSRHGPGDPYVNVPLSVAFNQQQWVMHVNAGATRPRDTGRTLGTWGFGHEIRVAESVFFTPEIFRNALGRPFYQAGLRFIVVPDRVQIDTMVGERVSGSIKERWYSIGVGVFLPPWTP
jgi:hypothetical protein